MAREIADPGDQGLTAEEDARIETLLTEGLAPLRQELIVGGVIEPGDEEEAARQRAAREHQRSHRVIGFIVRLDAPVSEAASETLNNALYLLRGVDTVEPIPQAPSDPNAGATLDCTECDADRKRSERLEPFFAAARAALDARSKAEDERAEAKKRQDELLALFPQDSNGAIMGNALVRNGINSVQKVREASDEELLDIVNIGRKRLAQIRALLEDK